MGSAGTRERIIAANKYRPSSARKAARSIRLMSGRQQTHKHKGDIIIDERGRKQEVSQNGWY